MKWAVEIKTTSLVRRNLIDLLVGLGYRVFDVTDVVAFASPSLDALGTPGEVWVEAKKLRQAMTGPAGIDPDFTLGAVLDYASGEPKRHLYMEVKPGRFNISGSSATLTVSPPAGLSESELVEWRSARAEKEYQAKLESQRSKLEPAFHEPRAVKVLELLQREDQNGETLFKIYELVEGHPTNRNQFHATFGISKDQFDRFSDAVHNPVVSGDLARHAYHHQPKTTNPMTINEAKAFVERLARNWLASIRLRSGESR